MTGILYGTIDFDPGNGVFNLTSNGGRDVFVQKLDVSGNFAWAKAYGGSLNDEAYSISVDNLGNVYTSGYFQETVDFDPGPNTNNLSSNGGFDAFVHKLDTSGNFVWAKTFGGTDDLSCNSSSVDEFGNIYSTGVFLGTADFDPGFGTTNITSAGSADPFIQKLDQSGNFKWVKALGGGQFDQGTGIASITGGVYTIGSFSGTVDFDPDAGVYNLSSNGSYDGFVHKMSECIPTTGTDDIVSCDYHTWIDGNTYTSDNNSATYTLTNSAGCDSVVTLNLTINNVSDISTSLSGATITANNSNASYQWLDCENSNSAISGETNQSITPDHNGNYAVELTENGCVDTSDCVNVTSVGILESFKGSNVKIYPNPTDGNFIIDIGGGLKEVEVIINDVFGRVIFSKSYSDSEKLIINSIKFSGVYLVNVNSDNKRFTYKLIIK